MSKRGRFDISVELFLSPGLIIVQGQAEFGGKDLIPSPAGGPEEMILLPDEFEIERFFGTLQICCPSEQAQSALKL